MTGHSDTSAMPSGPSAVDAAGGVGERLLTFTYLGWWFSCGTRRIDEETFQPEVFCRRDVDGVAEGLSQRLPPDTDNTAYGSEAEALRHAEQQAIRWAHDRSGDGQGQF